MGGALAGRRVAVVGATGFLGSHLTEHLVWGGAEVLALARSERRLGNLEAVAGECRFAVADVRGDPGLGAAMRRFRPEIVFHLASGADAPESFAHMAEAMADNAVGTANVLEAARGAGAALVVYADSCKVYGNGPVPYRMAQPEAPVCSYAVGKAAGWGLCRIGGRMSGMAVCAVRSTWVYGPRQNPCLFTYVRECAARGRPVRLMGGAQTRDPLYVEDAVRAFLAAAAESAAWGSAVPVGGGCERAVTELCREMLELLGNPVEVVPDAFPARATEIWRSWCDNAEARELLKWSPRVGLRQGLARMLAREQAPAPA